MVHDWDDYIDSPSPDIQQVQAQLDRARRVIRAYQSLIFALKVEIENIADRMVNITERHNDDYLNAIEEESRPAPK